MNKANTARRISIRLNSEFSKQLTKNCKGIPLRSILEGIANNDKVLEIAKALSNSKEVEKMVKEHTKHVFSRQLKINEEDAKKLMDNIKIRHVLTAMALDSKGCSYILDELGLNQEETSKISILDILERKNY